MIPKTKGVGRKLDAKKNPNIDPNANRIKYRKSVNAVGADYNLDSNSESKVKYDKILKRPEDEVRAKKRKKIMILSEQ